MFMQDCAFSMNWPCTMCFPCKSPLKNLSLLNGFVMGSVIKLTGSVKCVYNIMLSIKAVSLGNGTREPSNAVF